MKRIFTRGLLMGLATALASPRLRPMHPKTFKVGTVADIDYCDIPNDPDLEAAPSRRVPPRRQG